MSKVIPLKSRETIRAEARRWVLAFNEDKSPSEEDIAALREWVNESPIHREELEKATVFWCDADRLSILAVTISRYSGMGSRLRNRLARWMKTPAQYRFAGFALFILLGMGVLLWPWAMSFNNVNGNGIYSTLIGEQKTLTLSDKSVILMDTDTRIKVAYDDSTREIHLLQGQAHFEVEKNAHRPFDVYADYGLIRAVGTAFSVSLASQDIKVIVDEGKVELARLRPAGLKDNKDVTSKSIPAKPVLADAFLSLEKGQSASFNTQQQNVVDLPEEELSRELAWREGLLIFDSKPLKEVVAEVGRYTETHIEITDPALARLEVGGRFRIGKLDALFDVLSAGFGVKVSRIDENHIQLSAMTGASN